MRNDPVETNVVVVLLHPRAYLPCLHEVRLDEMTFIGSLPLDGVAVDIERINTDAVVAGVVEAIAVMIADPIDGTISGDRNEVTIDGMATIGVEEDDSDDNYLRY